MHDPATPAPHEIVSNHHVGSNEIKKEDEMHEDDVPLVADSKVKEDLKDGSTTHTDDHPDAPPAKRRRISEVINGVKPSPRSRSPPWKSSLANGPTSFIDNGKRRSGRTNTIPLELQPQSGRRQTRAAYGKAADARGRPSYNISAKKKKEDALSRKSNRPGRPATRAKESMKARQTEVTQHDRKERGLVGSSMARSPAQQVIKRGPGRPRRIPLLEPEITFYESSTSAEDSDLSDEISRLPSPPLTLKKVMFRVRIPKPIISTPLNIPQSQKYASLQELLDDERGEDGVKIEPLNAGQIEREAATRTRIKQAVRAGRAAERQLFKSMPERQPEPKREYAHRDHLLAHVHHFRTLLRQEHRDHRRKAEILAHEAKKFVEDKRKRGRVKTAAEIEQEQVLLQKNRYKVVVKDLAKLWQAVEAEINAIRQREYEEERQAKLKGHLSRVLDRAGEMLKRPEISASVSDEDASDSGGEDGTNSGTDDSEEMSETDSESDSEGDLQNPDEEMSIEELRRKYESLPNVTRESTEMNESEIDVTAGSAAEDSDPETEMDSEFDTEDDDADSADEEQDDDDDEPQGLAALFSREELVKMAPSGESVGEDTSPQDIEMSDSRLSEPGSLIQELPNEGIPAIEKMDMTGQDVEQPFNSEYQPKDEPELQASREPSGPPSPRSSASKISEPESVSSVEPRPQNGTNQQVSEQKSSTKTPIPPLLRGTLREYQHEGLDWLANLYAGGRSGILADEMGLGKTIQSIALLAHLASTYEVWGPHLIVVPTSVMLNWEMEFKKFLPGFKILTYYGTLEERKQKRRGWMAPDSFNVCITSYQLVLQDANSFKRRQWHYMILDEAHNIKNFRSERWQTMMTFNTRARLLLTGTPLQNNLTELWSLLFFLHYGQENEGEDDAFAGLKEWSEWFKRPVESILEHGKQVLDQEDQEQVTKLHQVIRPFLLRRLKADVEKQMPLKYEHVEMCRLSKRQRQLYDGFMSRAQTKETLASGNYLSIINALMQLRKVCNHPDLFETRPINTSFAMSKSMAAEYEINDFLVRRKLFNQDPLERIDLDFLQLVPVSKESMSMIQLIETSKRHAYRPMKELRDRQWQRVRNRSKIFAAADRAETLCSLESHTRRARLQNIDRTMYYEAYKHHQHPVFGQGLLSRLDVGTTYSKISSLSKQRILGRSWQRNPAIESLTLVQSVADRSWVMHPLIEQYACVTPAVVANDFSKILVSDAGALAIRKSQSKCSSDPFHLARMKLSIAFPDKRLLQYDCGKLQRLDKLLRRLQTGGHRALIFTQMTKVLDILEQFLNIHGHRYLRLDGATKIEQRQILTDRFNSDPRILCFILSSRSGGLGINLTGADTVIFYDLDWNPAMDKQCTDRAHRIGQTRDVHIYRFVSEHTIESNILRKANQKQLLDDVVIQEGDFTTDHINRLTYRDMLDEGTEEDDMAGAAMDRVLGNEKGAVAAFEQAEDKEDIAAAKVATKEVQHADDGDFEDQAANTGTPRTDQAQTPGPFGATNAAIEDADKVAIHHIDDYLLRLQKFLVKDIPLSLPKDKSKKGKKARDREYQRQRRAR